MSPQRSVVYSAMRPTGRLHLGNLEGALRSLVALQRDYDLYIGVADLHMLTDHSEDTGAVRANVVELALDYLAAGIDPQRSIVHVQSEVPQHSELHLILSMITPVSWLERTPTYKERLEEQHISAPGYGLLGYPVLQTADILVYRADTVPVGKDQLPHLELSREIARRFNRIYGDVFPEPQAKLTEAPLVPGSDGRKMSKSYGNTIEMAAPPDEIRGILRKYLTDPQKVRRGDKGRPEICPIFALQRIYNKGEEDEIATGCRSGALGCVDCKGKLATALLAVLEPMQEQRRAFERDREAVTDMLHEGSARARAVAEETMTAVRAAMAMWSPAPA